MVAKKTGVWIPHQPVTGFRASPGGSMCALSLRTTLSKGPRFELLAVNSLGSEGGVRWDGSIRPEEGI